MASPTQVTNVTVELLAPAGNWDCARAAIENGANAIYFGLDCGFNARHRAANFGLSDLPRLTGMLRERGVRGYVTLNTLVFPSEMPALVEVVSQIAESGIDAVLVQDFGVARLVREICPDLEIHASTQMSLTSAETVEVAKQLGLSRVVVARELSVSEIRKIVEKTDIPVEVFIHGALCVAYSGQCLTSESLGGRSANRGQCAQACRLPYELICDGKQRQLDDVRYLLSPQDLAGYDAIPDLVTAGVASLKIEGRLKSPEYVANITSHYRKAIDQAIATQTVSVDDQSKREMELSFSRGFSPGWLRGNDHKRLVPGRHSAKRGIKLGTIVELSNQRLLLRLAAPVALGDGLAISSTGSGEQQGGRVYSLETNDGHRGNEFQAGERVWVGFGHGEIDWSETQLGDTVYKNDDPKLNRRLRATYENEDPTQRQPINLQVQAESGKPLRLIGTLGSGCRAVVVATGPLSVASRRPITIDVLRQKLGRLGGTPFKLGELHAQITDQPMVPLGLLNQLRRELVDALLAQLAEAPPRTITRQRGTRLLEPIDASIGDEASVGVATNDGSENQAQLAVLCRTLEQVQTACESNADLIYADFHDIRQYRHAIAIARKHETQIGIATVRMQKPGEMGLLRVLGRHHPDFILARNLAALSYFRDAIPTIADFSLNVANHQSAQWIRSLGAKRITASYDLNRQQLLELVDALPSLWMEIVIHQHMPMFHMEHCVFCSVLSPGTDKTNCGRPCDRHVVQLRDRVGTEHPLHADVACRNTLYNATPQSGAEIAIELLNRGIGWYRVELLEEDPEQTKKTISLYRQLLQGQVTGNQVWRQLKAQNRVGVTRGTLESKRDPLAIL